MADFFSEFNAVSTQEWQKSVEKVLKGQSIDTLNWQYDASLNLAPLYRKSAHLDASSALQYKAENTWDIVIRIVAKDYTSVEAMNAAALSHLAGGATELVFVLEEALAVETLLAGIWLDMVRISWQVPTVAMAEIILQQLNAMAGDKIVSGHMHIVHANMTEVYNFSKTNAILPFSKYSFFEVKISSDKTSLAQNLGTSLEHIVSWLQMFKKAGEDLALAVSQMQITLSVGDAYFVEIAKIRAFKRLWLAVLAYFEVETLLLPRLMAYTESVNHLDKNGEYSLLAATSQALSAVIAGVDGLCIQAPQTWEGIDTATAERLARNVHFILLQESHLNAVVDPSAGAYYIEAATAQLSETAWNLCNF